MCSRWPARNKEFGLRAVIADAQPLFRHSLAGILAVVDSFDDIVFVDTFAEMVDRIQGRDTHLVLLDLGLPGLAGLAGVVDVVNLVGGAPVVVVTDGHSPAVHLQSRICGVSGLFEKSSPAHQIVRTLTMALRGGLAFPDTLAIPTGPAAQAPRMVLTPKQLQVLALLTTGKSNKQIAKVLTLSPNTVKAHVSEVLRRLAVHTRAEAIALAREPWQARSAPGEG